MRAEHTEDFLADPQEPASWRTRDACAGNLGDLSPHIINAVLRLVGPIERLVADVQTVYPTRPGANGPEAVTNDDQVNIALPFRERRDGLDSRQPRGDRAQDGLCLRYHGHPGRAALRCRGSERAVVSTMRACAAAGRASQSCLPGPSTRISSPSARAPDTGPATPRRSSSRRAISCTRSRRASRCFRHFDDGLQVSRVIAAAFRSHAERRWVALAEF